MPLLTNIRLSLTGILLRVERCARPTSRLDLLPVGPTLEVLVAVVGVRPDLAGTARVGGGGGRGGGRSGDVAGEKGGQEDGEGDLELHFWGC